MDAIHINWTKPFRNRFNSPYEVEDFEILTTILSALKWREKNGNIKMVTDSVGAQYYKKTGLDDAVITGIASIEGNKVAAAVMDFDYMGGSMGSVVGEKVTRIIEKAIELRLPVLAITSSGGARMQESALSLMQMAKTSCAVSRLDDEGLLYINLLTEPTFGGVTASFGMLGDIIVAEQGARVGFAGRRVIEQTIRQKLPSDFQTAEYLLKYGQVDVVSPRKSLRDTLAKILDMHKCAK